MVADIGYEDTTAHEVSRSDILGFLREFVDTHEELGVEHFEQVEVDPTSEEPTEAIVALPLCATLRREAVDAATDFEISETRITPTGVSLEIEAAIERDEYAVTVLFGAASP